MKSAQNGYELQRNLPVMMLQILVTDLLELLSNHEFNDVEVVTTAQETLLFSLPAELRKDLRAAGKS